MRVNQIKRLVQRGNEVSIQGHKDGLKWYINVEVGNLWAIFKEIRRLRAKGEKFSIEPNWVNKSVVDWEY